MTINAETKTKLIQQVLETQDVVETYPSLPDGRPDFSAAEVRDPLTLDEVTYLVDRYAECREHGMGHEQAAACTLSIAYRQVDIAFSPHKKIAAMRARK